MRVASPRRQGLEDLFGLSALLIVLLGAVELLVLQPLFHFNIPSDTLSNVKNLDGVCFAAWGSIKVTGLFS